MATYIVSYDINKEGAAYATANRAVIKAIKGITNTWWHHLDSTWIIVSNKSATTIHNEIVVNGKMDEDDELLVAVSAGYGVWSGFPEKADAWLMKHL